MELAAYVKGLKGVGTSTKAATFSPSSSLTPVPLHPTPAPFIMDMCEMNQQPPGERVSMPGPTLTFHNIRYVVRESRGPCRKRAPEREILKNVRSDDDILKEQVKHCCFH